MFADQGILISNAIDAHMFQDTDGRYYLYYVDFSFRIHVREMTSPLEVGSTDIVLISPTEPWEMQSMMVTEGPWVLKHKGTYYLLYSGSAAYSRYYAVGYATSDSPLGPFTKYIGNPIIESGGGVYGPGHGSVTQDYAGNLWHVYHQKNGPSNGWDRFICIDPMWFDANDTLHSRATRGGSFPGPIANPSFDEDLDFDFLDYAVFLSS